MTLPRPVHRIPHRSNDILIGLVNLRGQLQLCISLHGLLGVDVLDASLPHPPCPISLSRKRAEVKEATDAGSSTAQGSRLVVLRDRERSETWIFAAEEVLGVHRLARAQTAKRLLQPGQPRGQLQPGDPVVGGPKRRLP